MEAIVPASYLNIASLTLQILGLLTLGVMVVRMEIESKRFMREFEALIASATGEETPSIDPSSC